MDVRRKGRKFLAFLRFWGFLHPSGSHCAEHPVALEYEAPSPKPSGACPPARWHAGASNRSQLTRMADRITPERRSWNMSRIRGRNTGPELQVRSLLHRLGYRFSLTRTDLPGKPDIVLPRWRTIIFVHGCFWHRHKRCSNSVLPKTRPEFWVAKLESNVERDRTNAAALRKLGWRVLVVGECEREDETRLTRRILAVLKPNS